MKTKEELKTLKDLKIEFVHNLGSGESDPELEIVKIIDLKQEAIKWVRLYDRENLRMGRWEFMKFHNLTEEDLKGEEK